MSSPESPELLPDLEPQAILAIYNDDLDTLRHLLETFPPTLDTLDADNNNLLQLSVFFDKYEIFSYLLALNHFDLEATNSNNETALFQSLADCLIESQNFALDLIKKGANVNSFYSNKNTALHLALKRHWFQAAEGLIKRGANLDAQNLDGCTPFHMLFHVKTDPEGVSEGVGLMIYYGADASICDKNGNLPFELAMIYDPSIIAAQENLLFYTFDNHEKYSLSMEVLFALLTSESDLFPQIADFVTEIVSVKGYFPWIGTLFKIKPQFLEIMIERFPEATRKILSSRIVDLDIIYPYMLTNFELLLNSELRFNTTDFITSKLETAPLLDSMKQEKLPLRHVTEVIIYLISYGMKISQFDLDIMYQYYGYCDLFKMVLYMEIENCSCDVIPRVFYDPDFDFDWFLADPRVFFYQSCEKLLDHFVHPKLRSFCYTLDARFNLKKLGDKVETLPRVPLLTQLARDAARKYLIERFNLKTSSQYFTLINQLPITIYKKILSFETKLYI